jgi:hypothetical protein
MTTTAVMKQTSMFKYLPFDITNLIYEFLGDEDKKQLFNKYVMCNQSFVEELNRRFCSNLHHIRDKREIILRWVLFKNNYCHSVSDILFEDEIRIQVRNMEQKFNYRDGTTKRYFSYNLFECGFYSNQDIKEVFEEYYRDDLDLVSHLDPSTISEFFNHQRGKAKLDREQVGALQDYNNHILQSVLKRLIGCVDTFVEWYFENNYWEMVSAVFGDEDSCYKIEGLEDEDMDLLRLTNM